MATGDPGDPGSQRERHADDTGHAPLPASGDVMYVHDSR
jgi:hypothetical protein